MIAAAVSSLSYSVFLAIGSEAATSLAPYLPYVPAILAAGGFLWFCVRGIAFFAVLKGSVQTLTNSVVQIQSDVKEAKREVRIAVGDIQDRLVEHATDLALIKQLLDLDDKAQRVIREKMADRRGRTRRATDRVSEEVLDILEHQREAQSEGEGA